MNERQREELLGRIQRSSSTVGSSIPDTVTLDGKQIPLRDFFFDVSDREDLESDERQRVEDILTHLRRERLRLKQLIQNDEVKYTRGKELVSKIVDLERAINAFESLDEPSLEEQLRQKKIESAQELVDLMRAFGK